MPRVLNYKRDGLPPAVYIGRLMPRYGLPGSKWHNPYKVGRDGTREEVIAKYQRHLHDSGLIYAVHELRGRDLVCWCAPEPCHGDLLLQLANAVESQLPLTTHPPGAAARPASCSGS
jgi:hypothetical protein